MSFTRALAERNAGLWQQIRDMPFNRELAAGTLPAEVFQGYIIQDAHYLEGFARALALAAARAPSPETVAQLASSANGAIVCERSLHTHYLGAFGVTEAHFEATEVSAACDHYLSFLLRMAALGEFAEALAALLPCFWIYRDIGQGLAGESRAGNPYAAWIETYSGEAFDAAVQRMLALTEHVAATAPEATRARMHRAFARSCWHEWHFWDSAYRQRQWPMPGA